jgi:hypothetical protein
MQVVAFRARRSRRTKSLPDQPDDDAVAADSLSGRAHRGDRQARRWRLPAFALLLAVPTLVACQPEQGFLVENTTDSSLRLTYLQPGDAGEQVWITLEPGDGAQWRGSLFVDEANRCQKITFVATGGGHRFTFGPQVCRGQTWTIH